MNDKISTNKKQIYVIWNGCEPESESDHDAETVENVTEKIVDADVANNDEMNDECENTLDQTFLNPSAGIKCEDCNFVAKSKSDLKKHKKSKHVK